MASPPSPASSVGSDSLYNRPPMLEDLVNHFVASKRSLNSATVLWRANEIVNSARLLLEENAILAAKNSFIRCSIAEQVDALEAVRRGIAMVETDITDEFKQLLHSLDSSFAGLQSTLTVLKSTPIEPALQPSNTPQKHLFDFIDSATVTDLSSSLRSCIDRYHSALSALHSNTDAFDDSLKILHTTIASLPDPPATHSNPTPLPMLFHDLEFHATEAATAFQSLVRHYDLCVTALKHTEGGGEAATRATSSLPDLTTDADPTASAFASPPEPLSDAERADMLSVLQKDAAEVDDVVSEIRDRASEMEYLLSTMTNHISALRAERHALLSTLHHLHTLGTASRSYISATHAFTLSWFTERAAITDGIDEWDSLRTFYENFDLAYSSLLVEVAARRKRYIKARKRAQEMQAELEALWEEDRRARESFNEAQGDFLPADIWQGLREPPKRWEVVGVEGEGDADGGKGKGSVPVLGREAVERAVAKVRGRV
ncbi:hypothetical protein K432DRAFT_336059 [Lepidopterella palustris CBS 459.81]|uniref:Autophagy-related protein 17 n=1 Tax=Lepidopterella palustris CBS 459.81 TaxID=1314670 RepID=A0A8E2E2T5_9PEZI|nr:hypothetical protein K432DRAFT_336059 [Lepidopterella palustris CBS 459.81]